MFICDPNERWYFWAHCSLKQTLPKNRHQCIRCYLFLGPHKISRHWDKIYDLCTLPSTQISASGPNISHLDNLDFSYIMTGSWNLHQDIYLNDENSKISSGEILRLKQYPLKRIVFYLAWHIQKLWWYASLFLTSRSFGSDSKGSLVQVKKKQQKKETRLM